VTLLDDQIALLDKATTLEMRGTVQEVTGLAVRVSDLPVPVGAQVEITTGKQQAGTISGEVVGFGEQQTIVMPIGATTGICRGDMVIARQFMQTISVGDPDTSPLGRVLDGRGQPIDGKGPILDQVARSLHPQPIEPMSRPLIDTPLATGIRAIDAFASVGRGQRLGVIAAPGIGKSILLGMMARSTEADVSVIALVGERGREVRDFIHNHLGDEGLAKSVVICATGDEPPLLRLHAALAAVTVAEFYRDRGCDVLLIMDSITRFCQAQRQIGLAAGEPPVTKGYPPSVFTMLPKLLERCGRTQRGSITGFFAVLTEGEDMADPIEDAARGVLDGHIVLSSRLANQGHWPAIDVVQSISRVSDSVTDTHHQSARQQVLQLVSAYREVEDLLNIGAYSTGNNPVFDLAIACKPAIDALLRQGRHEPSTGNFQRTHKQLLALIEQINQAKRQLEQPRRSALTGPQATVNETQ